MKKIIISMVLILFVLAAGCASSDYKVPGELAEVENPELEKRTRSLMCFNEATEILAQAARGNGSEIDMTVVDRAVERYLEAAKIDPDNPVVYKQLGVIFEVIKKDKDKALEYYGKYASLKGEATEREILSYIEENKPEPKEEKPDGEGPPPGEDKPEEKKPPVDEKPEVEEKPAE